MKFEAKSMLNMLCRSLYDTSLVVLRENLQNAYDAVLMRKHVDSNYANPEIRLYVKEGHLIVQDNGIGMTEKEVDENFWTAGRSGKNNADAKAAGVVGTFGIGAFANFGVCSGLKLTTKKIFSDERCDCFADKEHLDEIKLETYKDDVNEYGTTIDATMDAGNMITAQEALTYVTPYVEYLKIPVYFNDTLISQKDYEGVFANIHINHYYGVHYGLEYNFDYQIDIYSERPVHTRVLITNLSIGNDGYEGNILLDSESDNLFGLRNGFGLSSVPLATDYSFGGLVNMSMLIPTAGREAINTSCLDILQKVMNIWELHYTHIISELEVADSYRQFLYYLDSHGLAKWAKNVCIQKANEDNKFIKLHDMLENKEHARYYFGADNSILKKFADSDYLIGVVSREYPRRSVQLKYLHENQVKLIDDKVEIKEVYDLNSYEMAGYYAIKTTIQNILKYDYLINQNDVEFANISHNLPYFVEQKNDVVMVYIQKEDTEIKNIISIYQNDYSVFEPLLKDYVRNYIYQQIQTFIPSSSKAGIEAFCNMMKKKNEAFSIYKEDLMSIDSSFNLFKEGKITEEQFSAIIRKSQQKSQQTVNVNNVQNVDEVVKTLSINAELGNIIPAPQQQDTFEALPPIMRLEVETKAKLLKTDVNSSLLHGYKIFLTLTDAMTKEYYTFFMRPHTTRVIWSMHRIIFIFTLENGSYTLYYDMELKKHLDSELTGGGMVPTTTIITKDKVFVPIPHELEEYFSLREGALKFSIHYDSVEGE